MIHTGHRGRRFGPRDDDRHFDSWSRTYDRSPTQVLLFSGVQRSVTRAVAGRVGAGRVLDIGAGTGRLLDRLGTALPRMERFGLDRSAGMLEAAHRVRPYLHLTRGTAEALPFSDESFDLVVSTLSFHHWRDQAKALAEVRRVLRPGGVLALADVSIDDLPRWGMARLLGRRFLGHGLPLHERRRLLEGAGLAVVDERRSLYGHWIPLTVAQRAA